MLPANISPKFWCHDFIRVLIDFMLSGASKDAWELVKQGFSYRFRVQHSGDEEMLLKLPTSLEQRGDFPLHTNSGKKRPVTKRTF